MDGKGGDGLLVSEEACMGEWVVRHFEPTSACPTWITVYKFLTLSFMIFFLFHSTLSYVYSKAFETSRRRFHSYLPLLIPVHSSFYLLFFRYRIIFS